MQYQLSVIRMDASNIGRCNLESNLTNMFVYTKILHDDYVIHFLAFGLECFDCSYIPWHVEISHIVQLRLVKRLYVLEHRTHISGKSHGNAPSQ